MPTGFRNIAFVLALLAPLAAPAQPSFEHAPGTDPYNRGNRAYRAGQYGLALDLYRNAARWAHKLSQFNAGVMYYHGQGTAQDLPRAWAWFALSAERGYPELVNVAAQIWDELDEAERARGREILEEELLPVYGDERTIPRTAQHMERERRRATGTRTGSVGFLKVIDEHGVRDGTDFYADENWDFHALVEYETKMFEHFSRARVVIGELDVIDDGDEDDGDDGER